MRSSLKGERKQNIQPTLSAESFYGGRIFAARSFNLKLPYIACSCVRPRNNTYIDIYVSVYVCAYIHVVYT